MASENQSDTVRSDANKPATAPYVGRPANIEQLLYALDQYVESYPDEVFREAIRSQVELVKESLGDVLVGRVLLRSLQQVRQTSHKMFSKLARRAARLRIDHHADVPKNASIYRSATYLDRNDYFQSPFIRQMAVHRDIAVRRVAREHKCGPTELVSIERVLVIPEAHWRSGDQSRLNDLRAWWQELVPVIDQMESEGPIHCVREDALSSSGNMDDILDFGLYGDVAVGAYRRTLSGEELYLGSSTSELFARCERMWDRFFHASSKPVEWKEVKRTLGIQVVL